MLGESCHPRLLLSKKEFGDWCIIIVRKIRQMNTRPYQTHSDRPPDSLKHYWSAHDHTMPLAKIFRHGLDQCRKHMSSKNNEMNVGNHVRFLHIL